MKFSKRFFSTLIAIAMLVTVITSFNITTVMATEAAQIWDWNAAISAGADLNAENSTSPFTIWEIKFANATADFGTFAPMVFAGGNYTGTNGARGLVLEKGTNVNGHYISPGCNTDTGAISGIAIGFTAPFDGVYTLTAVITLKDGNSATGSDNLYGGTIAEWYTLKGQDATVKDNFKQFNAARDESVDFGATYELKEGETVYLVSDPNGNHGGDCAYLKYSVSGIEDTTVGDDNTGDDTPTVTPDEVWDWNAAISAGADLNAENSTSPFTIWEIKFSNATADFGTLHEMIFNNGSYKGTSSTLGAGQGLLLEKNSNAAGHYISPGCNTNTGEISGIGIGFTAPFDGVYTLTAVITLKDGNNHTGSDNLYGGTIAEWYTLKGQDATVKDNFKQFNAAKEESVDFEASYELKEGETVYLVTDPNGNHWGDCAYLKYSVSGVEDTTPGDDNTGDDTPTVTPNKVWNWNAAISAGNDLNAENSTSPFTIWEIKFANASADFGSFQKMTFSNGNYLKVSTASGLVVEKGTHAAGHYISPGCNTNDGAIAGVGIGFTAPFDGVFTLSAVITLKDGNTHTGSDNLYGGTIAEWYTLKGQDAATKDNFKQFNGAALSAHDFEATYELKEGETVYLVTDPNGNHWGDCAYLKYSVSGIEDTTVGDDNTGDDNVGDDNTGDDNTGDESNPGTSDTTASLVVTVAVVGAACGAFVALRGHKNH